mmetsp:Transcript_56335/g.111952  ORF Transcript_56335/g.111952 Transcript_56335/m.111952 type:complete len:663 (-) Transcript_56335:218-2206(-)
MEAMADALQSARGKQSVCCATSALQLTPQAKGVSCLRAQPVRWLPPVSQSAALAAVPPASTPALAPPGIWVALTPKSMPSRAIASPCVASASSGSAVKAAVAGSAGSTVSSSRCSSSSNNSPSTAGSVTSSRAVAPHATSEQFSQQCLLPKYVCGVGFPQVVPGSFLWNAPVLLRATPTTTYYMSLNGPVHLSNSAPLLPPTVRSVTCCSRPNPVAVKKPAVSDMRLLDLPVELLQEIMDFLPTFGERVRMRMVAQIGKGLQWCSAPPLQASEEMSGLSLGNLGARAVAWAFAKPTNPSIGELSLGNNGIGNAGAMAIAAVLRSGPPIRRLSLRDNAIGDAGAESLASALAMNTVLEELDMWGNRLTSKGKAALVASARCKVFLEMDLPRQRLSAWERLANGRMRAVLFDWISQVHTGGHAPVALDGDMDPQDLLFRTFSYIDAYYSAHSVWRSELQLTGVACTLAATGLQDGEEQGEEHAELSAWLAFVTEGACTADDVCEAALRVQKALGFKMHKPTAYTFLRRYLRKTGWTQESFSLANYLIELAVVDANFCKFRPQAIAAAATVLSRQYLAQGIGFQQIPCWKAKLLRAAQLDLRQELAPCAAAMSHLHAAEHGRTHRFVNKKYEWQRLHVVSKLQPNAPADAAYFVNYLEGDTVASQ